MDIYENQVEYYELFYASGRLGYSHGLQRFCFKLYSNTNMACQGLLQLFSLHKCSLYLT